MGLLRVLAKDGQMMQWIKPIQEHLIFSLWLSVPFVVKDYFCGRLAGGTIPFIRRYSTIWP